MMMMNDDGDDVMMMMLMALDPCSGHHCQLQKMRAKANETILTMWGRPTAPSIPCLALAPSQGSKSNLPPLLKS